MDLPTLTPDLGEFRNVMRTLYEQFGRDIRFYGPADIIPDPSIPASEFDDEGLPLDPLAPVTVLADAGVQMERLRVVGSGHGCVLFQPLAAMRRDETAEDEIAFRSRLNKDLIFDADDRHVADGASHFMVGTFARDATGNVLYNHDGSERLWTPDDGELWHIANAKTDGVGAMQRFIVFGQGVL